MLGKEASQIERTCPFYLHLRKHSTEEPVAEIIQFPRDRVHWMNYYEQKEAEYTSSIPSVYEKSSCIYWGKSY